MRDRKMDNINLKEYKEKISKVLNSRDETLKVKDTLDFKLLDSLQTACEKSLYITESLNTNMNNLLEVEFGDIKLCEFEKMISTISKINSHLEEIEKLL